MKSIILSTICLYIILSATQSTPLRGFGGPSRIQYTTDGQAVTAYSNYNSAASMVPLYPNLLVDSISSTTSNYVQLFNAGDYIMLECKLNGKTAYFMVDTGASYTVLHSKSAKSYGFQVLERKGQQTTGFGGNSFSVQIAIGAGIDIGNRKVSMGFLAQDLSKMIRLVHSESKVRITGIVGTDLLKRLGCSLDIGNKVLRWTTGA